MIQYLLFKEPQRWGEPIFSTLNVIMWSKTEDNLCTTELEQEVRKLLMWLNAQGKMYHIEFEKNEQPGMKSGDVQIIMGGGGGVLVGRNGTIRAMGFNNLDPMVSYILNVDEETAVLMKLFYPKFIPIPLPPPEIEVVVAVDPIGEDSSEDEIVIAAKEIPEPNTIPWWRRLLPTN